MIGWYRSYKKLLSAPPCDLAPLCCFCVTTAGATITIVGRAQLLAQMISMSPSDSSFYLCVGNPEYSLIHFKSWEIWSDLLRIMEIDWNSIKIHQNTLELIRLWWESWEFIETCWNQMNFIETYWECMGTLWNLGKSNGFLVENQWGSNVIVMAPHDHMSRATVKWTKP